MNKNLRLCEKCRRYFCKSDIIISRRGHLCKDCFEKYKIVRLEENEIE